MCDTVIVFVYMCFMYCIIHSFFFLSQICSLSPERLLQGAELHQLPQIPSLLERAEICKVFEVSVLLWILHHLS